MSNKDFEECLMKLGVLADMTHADKVLSKKIWDAGQRQMNKRCVAAVANVDPSEYGMRGGAVKNACLEAVKETKP